MLHMPAVQTSPSKGRRSSRTVLPGLRPRCWWRRSQVHSLVCGRWLEVPERENIFSQPLDFAHNGRESSVPFTCERESTKDLFSQPLDFAHSRRKTSVPLTYGRESTKGLYSQLLDFAHSRRETSVSPRVKLASPAGFSYNESWLN